MAIDDGDRSEAIGAEKKQGNVRRVVWFLMLGVLLLLCIALIIIRSAAH